MLTSLAIKAVARGFRIPHIRRFIALDQLAKTISLLRQLDINVFIDVGANRGLYAKHIRDAGYRGLILSFEPIAEDCERVMRVADEQWVVMNYALGAESGCKLFNLVDFGGHTVLSSFLTMKDIPATRQIRVSVMRLDDVIPSLIKHVDNPKLFLKMDTQGFDSQVLDGATNLMPMILGLQSEVPVLELYEGMRSYTRSLERYHELGFGLLDLFVVNKDPEGFVIEYDCLMKRRSMDKASNVD